MEYTNESKKQEKVREKAYEQFNQGNLTVSQYRRIIINSYKKVITKLK